MVEFGDGDLMKWTDFMACEQSTQKIKGQELAGQLVGEGGILEMVLTPTLHHYLKLVITGTSTVYHFDNSYIHQLLVRYLRAFGLHYCHN